MKARANLVQTLNPRSKKWVLIDTNEGKIIKYSSTPKPFKNITIIDKNIKGSDDIIHTEIEPIHNYFELSYAQYITIPRTVLQSMPVEWQIRFVECMTELDKLIDWRQNYYTYLRDKKGRFMNDPLADYERGRRRLPFKTKV
jgi:hypothetical protein